MFGRKKKGKNVDIEEDDEIDEEEQKSRRLGKKQILMIGLAAALIAGGAAYFLKTRDGRAKLPDPVDAYTLGEDSVASITTLEDVGKEVLLSISTSDVSEEDAEKAQKEKEKEERERSRESRG